MVSNNMGGPHGLGDPDDTSLRKVELEVMIPKIMRDRAKQYKCVPEVKAFETCCKDSGIMMWYTCRSQNQGLKDCLTRWYSDEGFKEECTRIYLAERAEFRKTGLSKKKRDYLQANQQQQM